MELSPQKGMSRLSITDRFMAKVFPEPMSGCWLWVGAINWSGYGTYRLRGTHHNAHRVAYLLFVGSIPPSLEIDHKCRNRLCVNPDHLEAVTHAVNQRRGAYANKTHCKHGHAYTAENTYRKPNGKRNCRRCRTLAAARWYAKKKEKSFAL